MHSSNTTKEILWQKLLQTTEESFPVTTGTGAGEVVEGICPQHAYAVSGAYEVDEFQVVKVRNPHGKNPYTGELCKNYEEGTETYDEINEKCD